MDTIRFIILQRTKLGERQLVLHTLSAEYGSRSFICAVPRSGALTLPLSIVEATLIPNSKSDLWRVKDLCPLSPLDNLRSSMTKNAIALFMSEVLYRILKDGESEDGLYEWTKGMIEELDEIKGSTADFPLHFLLGLCTALGFKPDSDRLSPYVEGTPSPATGAERTAMAESILRYLSAHTDTRLDIRSLGVLHELCADFVTLPSR